VRSYITKSWPEASRRRTLFLFASLWDEGTTSTNGSRWLRLIGVHEIHSVIVDNAWNQDHAQSEASLADGKQSVERIVRGFWGLCEPIETGIGVRDNGLEVLPASKRGPDALVHHKPRTM
jgi:hypothetical protein